MQNTPDTIHDTSGPDMNPTFKSEFEFLLEELNAIQEQINTAKTRLKKEYYTKKLDKARQRVYRHMMKQVTANPSLLKKRDEPEATDE